MMQHLYRIRSMVHVAKLTSLSRRAMPSLLDRKSPRYSTHCACSLRNAGLKAPIHGSATSKSATSQLESLLITRTILSACATIAHAGIPPDGVATYASDIIRDEPSSLRLTVKEVPSEQAEQLADILLGFGAESVIVQESGAEAEGKPQFTGEGIFDDGSGTTVLWDSCTVQAHFSLAHDMLGTIELAKRVLGQPNLQYEVQEAVPREWVEAIKASYVPLQITPELWIIPDWSQPVDPDAVNIILQPGVAFGTGEHPTTRMCLQHLLSADLAGKRLIDYGTGSGVLAIAALLLGASHAVGTDVDELSLRSARRNAELNGVGEQLQVVRCGASIREAEPLESAGIPTQFDVCVSNILRGPLLDLQPRLASYVRPGGQIILSGVLQEQVPDIKAAYGEEFTDFSVHTDNGWAMLTATKMA